MNNKTLSIQLNKNNELVTESAATAGKDLPADIKRNGYIRVLQVATTIETKLTGSFVRTEKRSAFITSDLVSISLIAAQMQAQGNNVPGGIFIKEFSKSNLPAAVAAMKNIDSHIKRAGNKDAPMLTVGGEPIYRLEIYYSDADRATNTDAFDLLVAHDNGDQIKAYQITQQAKANSEALLNAGKSVVDTLLPGGNADINEGVGALVNAGVE